MQVFRIEISSWTASFRYPNMISGFQPTLRVPPISTICGLVSAAAGRLVTPKEFEFAYSFRYDCTAVDLETIYQFGLQGKPSLRNVTSNIMRREFLAMNRLLLYLNNRELAMAFNKPYFPLLLGRSGDLATVDSISQIELQAVKELNLAGTVVPFLGYRVASPIQALPTHFSNDFPRRNLGTQPFYILDWQHRGNYPLHHRGWHDTEHEIDLFWYDREVLPVYE
ncbi:MAG: type I-B CRISPR-associated protein Cas5 [Calditrichaeota bacterium]|nr:MAG: type I-B CRISPR-associated protein Cas5 [Calditrichota bacterium]